MQRSLDLSAKGARRSFRQGVSNVRTQRRRLVNLGTAGGASVVVALSGLAMLALNARGLGSEQFGIFVTIQAAIALLGAICATESWQSLCRLGTARDCDLPYLCKQALALDGIAAVAAFLIAMGAIGLAAPLLGVGAQYRDLAAIHSLVLLAGITGSARGYFRLRDRFDIIAANQVLNAIFGLVLAAILLWRGAGLAHYIYAFTALAIAYKLQLLGHMLWHLRQERRAALPDARRYRFVQLARMSLGVSILTTLIISRRNVAVLVVSAVLGPVATGLFAAALKCTGPLAQIGEMVKQVLFADAIRAFRDAQVPVHRLRKLKLASLGLLALVLIAAGCVALVAEPMLGLLLGQAFAAAAPILTILVLVEGLQLAASVFNPVLQARGATRLLIVIYALAQGGFVVATLALGAALGASGIAAMMLAAFALAYVAQFVLIFGPAQWTGMGGA